MKVQGYLHIKTQQFTSGKETTEMDEDVLTNLIINQDTRFTANKFKGQLIVMSFV